jgi:hypothetical protein
MIKNQIDILTPGFSFGHNLCCKYSNGSCEPILDIYVSRNFQWYKELSNPMSFDLLNYFLKIQKSIAIPTPKVESIWECVSSFFHIPLHSQECECDFWVAFSTHTFPCLCLGREPKARIMKTCPFRRYKQNYFDSPYFNKGKSSFHLLLYGMYYRIQGGWIYFHIRSIGYFNT